MEDIESPSLGPLSLIADTRPCPTVKVQADEVEGGYMIVNLSDFDPKTMKKYSGKKSKDGE